MLLPQFEALLKQTMGLDAASIGSSVIERAVLERLSACHLKDSQAYWEHVLTSEAELQELIEAVVVPETWFFRDSGAFAALAGVVLQEWLQTHPEGVFRLLSLPCSTGEEPYSMAMALLDAGFPASRFCIDAVDISARALAHARRAIYGKNSFRSNDLSFRDRHFESKAHGYHVAEAVRRQVHFEQGNLLAPGFRSEAEIYDVIFCRNVLIYFNRATQDRAIKVLERLLTAKGFLFVGPSETGLLLSHDFVSAKVPLAFAFRKSSTVPREPKPVAAHTVRHVSRQHWPAPPMVVPKPAHVLHAKPAASAPYHPQHEHHHKVKTDHGLEEAVRLADQGHLAESAKQCEEHLRKHEPSAQAFYLMGLVRDAAGESHEAVDYYRKALYLDPHHHETLAHLALLLDRQGDRAGAEVLRNRAQRRQAQKSTGVT